MKREDMLESDTISNNDSDLGVDRVSEEEGRGKGMVLGNNDFLIGTDKKDIVNDIKNKGNDITSKVPTEVNDLDITERPENLENSKVKTKKKIKKDKNFILGFIDFVNKNSVFGIAIGLVIGAQVQKFINSLVENIITPFLNIFIGIFTSTGDSFVLNIFGQDFLIGSFIASFLEMIIVMFVIYFVVKIVLNRADLVEDQSALKPKSTIGIEGD